MSKQRKRYNNSKRKQFELEAVLWGTYLIESGGTIRSVARFFGVSKSTVHTRFTKVLFDCNSELYSLVRNHLINNKKLGTIRGGMRTKELYKGCKKNTIHNVSSRRKRA